MGVQRVQRVQGGGSAGITMVAYQGAHAGGRPEGLLGPASGRHQHAARAIPQLGAGGPSHPQALLCCPMTLQRQRFLSFVLFSLVLFALLCFAFNLPIQTCLSARFSNLLSSVLASHCALQTCLASLQLFKPTTRSSYNEGLAPPVKQGKV